MTKKTKPAPKPQTRSASKPKAAKPLLDTEVASVAQSAKPSLSPAKKRSRMTSHDETPNETRWERSPYDVQSDELENALLSGSDARKWEEYLGEELYTELRDLVERSKRRSVRGGQRVLILPGITGSTLGIRGNLWNDTIWLDPLDIAKGYLAWLSLDGNGRNDITALDVFPFVYLKLKLRLRIAGYNTDCVPFDWRCSVDELGQELDAVIAGDSSDSVSLVTHSLSGLVSRAMLAQNGPGAQKVKQLIMLGPPNHGSFAPVQVLRGVYGVVRMVAAFDFQHNAEELATQVFSSFPSVYQMLPQRNVFHGLDIYNPTTWPSTGPQPNPILLEKAPEVQAGLHRGDERFVVIAGVGKKTVTDLHLEGGEFVYSQTYQGDGTVPLNFTRLPDVPLYTVEESHGSLAGNSLVIDAVKDLLQSGTTSVLSPDWRGERAAPTELRESEMPQVPKRSVENLSRREYRELLSPLAAPSRPGDGTAARVSTAISASVSPAYRPQLQRVFVGRRSQRRLDLTLAKGSITEVNSRAVVLGVFRDVVPTGAARAIDDRLDGAIADFVQRRMFAANVGEVFMLPCGRHPLRAETVLLAGLGSFDEFGESVAQLVAENVIRTFIRTQVDEFATLLLGGGSSGGNADSLRVTLRNLLEGFIRGLTNTPDTRVFRGFTLCELDPDRYQLMRNELFYLSGTPLFEPLEVEFNEVELPPAPQFHRRDGVRERGVDPLYLIVRGEENNDSTLFRASLLTVGGKATVIADEHRSQHPDITKLLNKLQRRDFKFKDLPEFGKALAELALPEPVRLVLNRSEFQKHHLVVVHDATASRLPWETLHIGEWAPAREAGLSRRYLADNLSIAKWLAQRQQKQSLNILVVINPTRDLDGAEAEGNRLLKSLRGIQGIRTTELRGNEATHDTLLREFQSGKYDVLHYAGHAQFDSAHPERSGILCAHGQPLRGADLVRLSNLPALVFFNACESGRVRSQEHTDALEIRTQIDQNVGLAEAFLRGGVANYIGTYWPVGDSAAEAFAGTFYPALLQGKSLGDALQDARREVHRIKSHDWADYIFYGSPDFVLKTQES